MAEQKSASLMISCWMRTPVPVRTTIGKLDPSDLIGPFDKCLNSVGPIIGGQLPHRCTVRTSPLFHTRLPCFSYVISQHTRVGLPLALAAWQNQSDSLFLERFILSMFLGSRGFERLFLLGFPWPWILSRDYSHYLILEFSK
jgi:hypothetical protein